MLQHKPQIDSLIEQKLSQGSQKVQFSAHPQLRKPSQNEDQEDGLIEIIANLLMTPVYSQGLISETFWTKIEKMTIVLATFASNGSGWVLEKVIKLLVYFARYRHITGQRTLHYLQNYKSAAVYLISVTMRTQIAFFTAILLKMICITILA